VRLFLEDESRFGLHEGHPRRQLTACGTKPHQRVLPRYEYTWFYAAVEPTTGDSLVLELPALDVACVQAFLDEFGQSYPETLNVLLWDGAPAHIAQALEVPENVLLLRLPAYSPELNPVERLWQDLREKLGSTLHASLNALKQNAAEILCAYTPETLASLCGYDYLLQAALALQP
jgi:hypothetical protein